MKDVVFLQPQQIVNEIWDPRFNVSLQVPFQFPQPMGIGSPPYPHMPVNDASIEEWLKWIYQPQLMVVGNSSGMPVVNFLLNDPQPQILTHLDRFPQVC